MFSSSIMEMELCGRMFCSWAMLPSRSSSLIRHLLGDTEYTGLGLDWIVIYNFSPLYFKTGSHFLAQTGLEITTRLLILSLPESEIIGMECYLANACFWGSVLNWDKFLSWSDTLYKCICSLSNLAWIVWGIENISYVHL